MKGQTDPVYSYRLGNARPILALLALLAAPAHFGYAVFGGETATIEDWPFVVYVEAGEGPCTGTLIHPEIVVTAAHCITPGAPATVGFGTHRAVLDRQEPARCWQNPDWHGHLGDRDFGYCRLESPVHDYPVASILTETSLVAGQEVTIVGFGVSEHRRSGEKRAAKTFVSRVTDGLRIGGAGKDMCVGDSGGPAFVVTRSVSERGPPKLAAISSGGRRCGRGGVFAPALQAVRWVEGDSEVQLLLDGHEG